MKEDLITLFQQEGNKVFISLDGFASKVIEFDKKVAS
jgi:hypothetical protein